jgi:hypothetical protein
MLYGLISLSWACYYLNSYYTGILIGYPFREQLRDVSPYLALSGLMGMAVYAVSMVPFPNDGLLLLSEMVTGIAVYVLLCRVLRLEAFMGVWEAGINKLSVLRAGASG